MALSTQKLILDPPLSAGVHSLSVTTGPFFFSRPGNWTRAQGRALDLGDVDVEFEFDGLRNEGLVGWMQAEGRQTDSLPVFL